MSTVQMLFLFLVGMMTCVLLARSGVVYYVKPTTSCPHSDTHCPSGETCLKLDNYINESNYYFSPDKVNITLYFMCGVHNQTSEKLIDIHDLQTFAMLGVAANETVTIHMPVQSDKSLQTYTFTNVSFVRIENVAINPVSIAVRGDTSKFIANNAYFYSNESPESTSTIILNTSQAFLYKCTLQNKVFVKLYSVSTLLIKNCTFQSCCDHEQSAVLVDNSTVYLSESVFFIHNSKSRYGAAIYSRHESIINITKGAYVHFINNSANSGGAVYMLHTVLEISENANVSLVGNQANGGSGGAIFSEHSMIIIRKNATFGLVNNTAKYGGAIKLTITHFPVYANSLINFIGNSAESGGAIHMWSSSTITLSNNATGYFSNNICSTQGGAIFVGYFSSVSINHSRLYLNDNTGYNGGACFMDDSSTINISNKTTVIFRNNRARNSGGAVFAIDSQLLVKDSNLQFYNNFAEEGDGGAIHFYHSRLDMGDYAHVSFINNKATFRGGAIFIFSDYTYTHDQSILIFVNNSASSGGALYLSLSWSLQIGNDSIIQFKSNSATKTGGALFVNVPQHTPCFLLVKKHSILSRVEFESNKALSGVGMHTYGASTKSNLCIDTWHTMPYCGKDAVDYDINITFLPNLNNSLSPVSSDPIRVCLCDANGKPQCAELSEVILNNITIIPGESIDLSIVVVGQDFGATTGLVYAYIQKLNTQQRKYQQWHLDTPECLAVNYTVNASGFKDHELLYLHTTRSSVNIWNQTEIQKSISDYAEDGCIDTNLLTTPVYFNITLLKCPKGFTLRDQQCHCFPVLVNNDFNCYLLNNKGYLKWSGSIWVGDTEHNNKIWFSKYCPLSYCNTSLKTVELGNDPDAQCAFNRAGLLCGGCKENYSLAIGSSRCIKCSSNSYLALFIVFAAAGLLLVIFIFSLNLTISQGLINGLVFYANIVWDYKIMLTYSSQPKTIMLPFRIFIAWLNLDFGVETCLVVGLTAFWKTWLQFIFPLYIWGIAGVIIIVCRYSTRLTNFIGDRAVPLLATLFYLSYMKLLRTVVSAFSLRVLTSYPSGSTMSVWYLDGNLPYFKPPHVYLFVASLAASVFFCIPFTLFLLSVRWLRKISHLRPLRWINKFTPIYDACFAPLHENHHQLFGVLLLIRAMLLIVISLTFDLSNPRMTNLLILFIITVLLLLYVIFSKRVFKSYVVKIFESVSILNLCLLSVLAMYAPHNEIIITEVSIGVSVFQFFVIILVSIIKAYCKTINNWKCLKRRDQQADDDVDTMYYERVEDDEINELGIYIDETNTVDT